MKKRKPYLIIFLIIVIALSYTFIVNSYYVKQQDNLILSSCKIGCYNSIIVIPEDSCVDAEFMQTNSEQCILSCYDLLEELGGLE